MKMTVPLITVIIPAFNEEKRIASCLQAFKSVTIPFELIVVDDGSTDKTVDIVSGFSFVKIIKGKHRGASAARNLGAQNAKGTILAFTDADCIPANDWLTVIDKTFREKPQTICLEGLTHTDKNGLFEHAVENEKGKGYQSCNLAVQKKTFLDVKGFDEQYIYFREDSDFAFKLLSKKIPVLFIPELRVFHPKRAITEKAFFRELFLVRNDILLFKKFPALYTEHFGFLCKGNVKQSAVVWALCLMGVYGAFFSLSVLLSAVVLLTAFRWIISMQKKQNSFSEKVRFLGITTVRDFLFPFFFVYYLLTVWPRTKK